MEITQHRERLLRKAAEEGFIMCASEFHGKLPPGETFGGVDFEPVDVPRARMSTVDSMIATGFLEPTDAFNKYRPSAKAIDLLSEKDRMRAERIAKREARKAA